MKPMQKVKKTKVTSATDELEVLAKQPVIAGIMGCILIICMFVVVHPDTFDVRIGGILCGLIGCLIYIICN